MKPNSRRTLQTAASAALLSITLAFAGAPQSAMAAGMVAGMGNMQSVSGEVTVKSVDAANRHMVVTDSSGDSFALKVPAEIRNFDQVKPGDKIKATYAVETEYVLSSANSPLPPDTETTVAARAAKGELPGAVVANHMVVTGSILGIDMAKHSLKVADPSGGQVHTIFVKTANGKKAMAKMKVGDTITAYVTEALLVSVNPS